MSGEPGTDVKFEVGEHLVVAGASGMDFLTGFAQALRKQQFHL